MNACKTILLTFTLAPWLTFPAYAADPKGEGNQGKPKGETKPAPVVADDIVIEKDIAYGTDEKQKLDLYKPKTITGKLPAVICLHGGGGDKASYAAAAVRLARRGYVAISANYREDPAPAYPKCLEDAKAALAWLCAREEVDAQRTGALGGSAGGWLSSMLGTQEFAHKVKCAINQFGPTDLTDPELEAFNPTFWKSPDRGMNKVFGPDHAQDKPLRQQASPVSHVSSNDADFIFTRSVNEKLVAKSQALRMIEKLRTVGKTVPDLYEFNGEGAGHATKMTADEALRIWKIQQDFLDKHLKTIPIP